MSAHGTAQQESEVRLIGWSGEVGAKRPTTWIDTSGGTRNEPRRDTQALSKNGPCGQALVDAAWRRIALRRKARGTAVATPSHHRRMTVARAATQQDVSQAA